MFSKWRAYYRRALRRYEPLALSVFNGPDNDYRSDRLDNRMTKPSPGQQPPVTHILPGGAGTRRSPLLPARSPPDGPVGG